MPLEDEFGDIIRKARYGLGLSVQEVASRSGLDVQLISDLESYHRSPTKQESDGLAQVLRLDPISLWTIAMEQHLPQVSLPQDISVERFVFSGMNSNGYLIHVPAVDITCAIDPGGDPAPMLASLAKDGRRLSGILLTHGHDDHVAGVERLRKETGVPVFAHKMEWSGDGLVDLSQRDEIELNGVVIEVVPTPGHTPNGVSFIFPHGVGAVGDTLFAGSLGRALDGPVWYPRLLESAHKILALSPETVLLPGHGPLTTVALELEFNPFVVRSTGGLGR